MTKTENMSILLTTRETSALGGPSPSPLDDSLQPTKYSSKDFPEGARLVTFHAEWCGWCKKAMPVIQQLQKEFNRGHDYKTRPIRIMCLDGCPVGACDDMSLFKAALKWTPGALVGGVVDIAEDVVEDVARALAWPFYDSEMYKQAKTEEGALKRYLKDLFGVNGFPTLYLIARNGKVYKWAGERDVETLSAAVEYMEVV